jgi:hypothetical protein
MLINSCTGRWSLLLTGLISARNNVHQGMAETGTTNVLWPAFLWPAFLTWLLFNVNDYKLSALSAFERKVLCAVYMNMKGKPIDGLRAALGEWQQAGGGAWLAATLGCFRLSIGSLVLALFKRPRGNAPGSC